MTPAEYTAWVNVQRRAAALAIDNQAVILRAFAMIRERYTDAELAQLIARGGAERVVADALNQALLDQAFLPLRQRIRSDVATGMRYFARTIPATPAVTRTIGIGFDILSPDVILAIRALETRVITTMQENVRETVRAYIENGLRDGIGPRAMAVDLRSVIGLAPNQLQAVDNFERMLRTGDRTALTRLLRDRRFDRTLSRVLGADGPGLTAAQIDTMTAAYRKRMVAFAAETNARTAALDSLKLGQFLSWSHAVKTGVVDGERLKKRWRGVLDARERPEHRALEGAVARWDGLFRNGERIPGDQTYSCRCLAQYYVESPS